MYQHRKHPPLAALRAFEAVGRLQGIRRAAKELDVHHAVVSRHIRSLETWVGAGLVTRTGSGYTLTERGAAYHEQIGSALTIIAAATDGFLQPDRDLTLSIECVPGFASLWLSDHLGDFIGGNADIGVDFRPSDHMPDLRTNMVDTDIRYIREWDDAATFKGVRRFDVIRPAIFPVASPACIERLGPIRSAADLLAAPLLHEDNDTEWRHWLLAHGLEVPERLPGSRLWHAHLTLAAARQGQGVGLANRWLLRDDLEAGRLVAITSEGEPFRTVHLGAYAILAREDRWNAPAVQRFRRWLQAAVLRDDRSLP